MALIRANAFAERHADKGLTHGGLRWQIFNENKNGMADAGVVIRRGRTVWIDEDRYFNWLRNGKAGAA